MSFSSVFSFGLKSIAEVLFLNKLTLFSDWITLMTWWSRDDVLRFFTLRARVTNLFAFA